MSGTRAGALKAWAKKRASDEYGGLTLSQLIARTQDGECAFCGEPAKLKKDPLGRNRGRAHFLTCGDDICKAAYHVFYGRERRAALRANEATLARLEAAP